MEGSSLDGPAIYEIFNANEYLVKNAPPTIRYIPEFISRFEEESLIERIVTAPKPKWENLTTRRLQNYGGIVGKKFLISDGNIPLWLSSIIDRISSVENGFPKKSRPNHVLINEYLPNQGIMPHTDGPVFFPLISTISLGSHTFLNFYEHSTATDKEPEHRHCLGTMYLEPRSLIFISDEAYTLLHGISEKTSDSFDGDGINVFNKPENLIPGAKIQRSTRYSLTIRNVPKVNHNLYSRLFDY